jgi:hypothetical protein
MRFVREDCHREITFEEALAWAKTVRADAA